jgi:hypothetical protein
MTSSINSTKPFEAENGLDIKGLIGEVACRHNVLIGPDDPIFATITLNELVLTRLLERQQEALSASQDQIVATTAQQIAGVQRLGERLVTAAAEHLAAQLRTTIDDALKQHREVMATELKKAHESVAKAKVGYSILRWTGIVLAAVFIVLVML